MTHLRSALVSDVHSALVGSNYDSLSGGGRVWSRVIGSIPERDPEKRLQGRLGCSDELIFEPILSPLLTFRLLKLGLKNRWGRPCGGHR